MDQDEQLKGDAERLMGTLADVLGELAGREAASLVASIRELAIARRRGDESAEARLAELISGFSDDQARVVGRAYSVYFDLANLAEDRQRVRVLRERERKKYPEPRSESIADAIAQLKAAGLTAHQVQSLFARLQIELVFTAHPTEAKRRSVRFRLRRLRQWLGQLDDPDVLPRERERINTLLRGELAGLWQTDFLRLWRPTVLQEVERGLSFAPTLWDVVPVIFQEVRAALAQHYPGENIQVGAFLRFGTWIGGDRDGNPNVTADVTKRALGWLRGEALAKQLASCRALSRPLSLSERRTTIEMPVREAVTAAAQRWPALEDRLASISPYEVYRRWLAVIEWRLEQTWVVAPLDEPSPSAYRSAVELENDLLLIQSSLRAHHGESLAEGELQDWIDQVRVFGFHLARLDVRQESGRYREAMAEVAAVLGLCENFAELSEVEKQAFLSETMPWADEIPLEALSAETREAVGLFRLLALTARSYGMEALGAHVVSLTRHPSDLLIPLWFWEWAKRKYQGPDSCLSLPIVPLFETLADLQRAPETLRAILEHPVFAEQIRRQGGEQMVMIGYSDSTKDAGYLAAAWALYRAQTELVNTAEAFGVKLEFFHGRGGSLGRGGGPTAHAIRSLPPVAVDGRLRVTEQGEVLAERYDDPRIAHRHLEQVTWGAVLVSALPPPPPRETWTGMMAQLAEAGFRIYRRLVDDPGFLEFFNHATPIDEIEQLPIGSRPARRRGKRTLKDLRAIPWVFAWTQCRRLVPAWYGLGSAIKEVVGEDAGKWDTLKTMYAEWPFFAALIDNAALAMAKVDLRIADRYAVLVADRDVAERMSQVIAGEFETTRAMMLAVMGEERILARVPWLDRSVEARNPFVDLLNLLQIELIRRLRVAQEGGATPNDTAALRDLVRLSIQGVAAGLRTTG